MPDDYFNQQQRQRAPRYAAGSDMDSITTGQEIRYSNGGNGGGKILIIVAVIILALSVVLTSHGSKEPEAEPSTTAEQRQFEGKIGGEIKDFFVSGDGMKATVNAVIENNTNEELYNMEVTFFVTDAENNTITEKTISISDTLKAGASRECTEIIDFSEYHGNEEIYISAKINAKHRAAN